MTDLMSHLQPDQIEMVACRHVKRNCPNLRVCQVLFRNWLQSYRQCLRGNVKDDYWRNLPTAIDKCLGNAMWKLMDVRVLRNLDDEKFVILSPNDPQ